MAVNDVAQVRVVGSQSAQTINVVTHWRFKSAGATLAGLLTALEASTTTFRDLFVAEAQATLSYTTLEGQMLIPFGAAPQIVPISPAWAGAGAEQPLPMSVALVITKRTNFIGRRARGRMYLPGWGADDHGGAGIWDPTFLGVKQGNANALVAQYGLGGVDADYEFGVWSRLNAGPPPPFDLAGFTAVTALTAQSVMRTQRRRQAGVGI